jgi:hypothetical protein
MTAKKNLLTGFIFRNLWLVVSFERSFYLGLPLVFFSSPPDSWVDRGQKRKKTGTGSQGQLLLLQEIGPARS